METNKKMSPYSGLIFLFSGGMWGSNPRQNGVWRFQKIMVLSTR